MEKRSAEHITGLGQDIFKVPIRSLNKADSPRLSGLVEEHLRALADVEEKLPPILVHRETMTIIDGTHRVQAALLNDLDDIEVRFFDGSEKDAFLLAVEMNVKHGLPLSKRDRHAAAVRILRVHPQQSDRWIAATTGLSAKTIAAIRRGITGTGSRQERRVGLDGRARPLNATEGRRLASEVIQANPEAPLRAVAQQAGISVGTVRDVRARLLAGADPVPTRSATGGSRGVRASTKLAAAPESPAGEQPDMSEIGMLLDGLRRDPSLRYTDAGRTMLMWLSNYTPTRNDLPDTGGRLPPHCGIIIARIARDCAQIWNSLAEEMERLSHCA
jgi:ParB-like chromosome segregation protein Spo0J